MVLLDSSLPKHPPVIRVGRVAVEHFPELARCQFPLAGAQMQGESIEVEQFAPLGLDGATQRIAGREWHLSGEVEHPGQHPFELAAAHPGGVLEDRSIRDSQLAQIPVLDRESMSPASRCIRRLAARLSASKPAATPILPRPVLVPRSTPENTGAVPCA